MIYLTNIIFLIIGFILGNYKNKSSEPKPKEKKIIKTREEIINQQISVLDQCLENVENYGTGVPQKEISEV